MKEILRCDDTLLLDLICSELEVRGIDFRVEGEAVNALMPIGEMFAPRLLVDDANITDAEQVIADLKGLKGM